MHLTAQEALARCVVQAGRGAEGDRSLRKGQSAGVRTRIWRAWERGEKIQPRDAASRPGGAAPVLMRWRRILRICGGSVMTARTRIGEPQRRQRSGLSLFAAQTAAAYEIDLVDLCKQPSPAGAGLRGGHGQIRRVLGGLGRGAEQAGTGGPSSSRREPGGGGGACGTMCHAIARNTGRSGESTWPPCPEGVEKV